MDCVYGAFAQADPRTLVAAGGGLSAILLVSTIDPDTARYHMNVLQPMEGGMGGRGVKDGVAAADFWVAYLRNVLLFIGASSEGAPTDRSSGCTAGRERRNARGTVVAMSPAALTRLHGVSVAGPEAKSETTTDKGCCKPRCGAASITRLSRPCRGAPIAMSRPIDGAPPRASRAPRNGIQIATAPTVTRTSPAFGASRTWSSQPRSPLSGGDKVLESTDPDKSLKFPTPQPCESRRGFRKARRGHKCGT
jgi:hypothetical protein